MLSYPYRQRGTRELSPYSTEKQQQQQVGGVSSSSSSAQPLLSTLRILFRSEEFRRFLQQCDSAIGEGLGTEFVSFASYIPFPR